MTEILTATGTILGTALLLILRDWRDGKSLLSKNPNPATLAEGMDYMRHHYNDDLTRILTEMQVAQKEANGMIIEILNNQEEMMKYGLKSLKE